MIQENVLIVYFSGTGGTKKIVKEFGKNLEENNYAVNYHPLDLSVCDTLQVDKQLLDKCKYLFVLYPVYSFDAPRPVYEWIESLPQLDKTPTAVISVSGGGDMFVNKKCREYCIRALEQKGAKVFYENMMVMPSNFAIKANNNLNLWLIKSIVPKVSQIVEEVLAEKKNRCNIPLKEGSKSFGQSDHDYIKKFGLSLSANDSCTSCSWCANNCPHNNIEMVNGKPHFNDNCVMCMRCIYGCTKAAISSEKYGFTILKDGYSIKSFEKQLENTKLQSVEKSYHGILWAGVKKYLLNDN